MGCGSARSLGCASAGEVSENATREVSISVKLRRLAGSRLIDGNKS